MAIAGKLAPPGQRGSAVNKTSSHDGNSGTPFLNWLPFLVLAACIGWMAYGFVTYPYAPIKPCGHNVFCDKRHAEYTQAEYEQFRYWEMIFIMSWPFGMASGYVIRRRRRKSAIVEEQE
jgi:hypothetical protein